MTHRPWIQTYSGRQFFLDVIEPEKICLDDIAHALSHLCRFGGHTLEFYSVAQHSIVVASECFTVFGRQWGLLHDAAEAYLVDVPKPIKPLLAGYAGLENRILAAIAQRFRLELPIPEEVHRADVRALYTERRDLLMPPPADWAQEGLVECFPKRIVAWDPTEAEERFLDEIDRTL
jgi:uncharacterized protein